MKVGIYSLDNNGMTLPFTSSHFQYKWVMAIHEKIAYIDNMY